MGNHIIFTTRREYAMLEGFSGGILLACTAITALISFFIFVCCCYEWEKWKGLKFNNFNDKNDSKDKGCSKACCKAYCTCSKGCCTERCHTCCTAIKKGCSSLESLHGILRTVFTNIKELQVHTMEKSNDISKLLVISDRKAPSNCNGFLAYTYYTFMMFMATMWFFVTAIDFSIYRKTTNCNDINVKVKSFRCFDIDNNSALVNCQAPNIDEKNVICYLYSPSIAGLGVAFSTAKLITTVADIGYKLIFKATNKSLCITISLRIIFIIVTIAALTAYVTVTLEKIVTETYFTFGHVPMRVAQLVLLCLTVAGILLLPPWCKYTDEEYTKKYYYMGFYADVESNINDGKDIIECIIVCITIIILW